MSPGESGSVRLPQLDLAFQRAVGVVDGTIDDAGDGEDTAHNGTHAREELQEAERLLAVDDAHRRDVKVEEHAYPTDVAIPRSGRRQLNRLPSLT